MINGLFGCFQIVAADIYMRFKKIKIYRQELKSAELKA